MAVDLLAGIETNFGSVDWVIVAIYLAGTVVIGLYANRYIRNMSDYMVAGRSLKPHLVSFRCAHRTGNYNSCPRPYGHRLIALSGSFYSQQGELKMAFWSNFWGLLLVVSMVIFAGVTVAVAIGGFSDIKSLFRSLESQHLDSPSDQE
jgi:Na+/proline symporter